MGNAANMPAPPSVLTSFQIIYRWRSKWWCRYADEPGTVAPTWMVLKEQSYGCFIHTGWTGNHPGGEDRRQQFRWPARGSVDQWRPSLRGDHLPDPQC